MGYCLALARVGIRVKLRNEKRMKVGFLQTFPIFGKKYENVETALSLIKRMDADLVVLPELFNTGYQFTSREEALALAEEIPDGETTQALIKLAKEKRLQWWLAWLSVKMEPVITQPYW